jgi:flavin-dependent dehydrogenase
MGVIVTGPVEPGGHVMGTYDAIVVGARCAGAPTAMLLARKGYRVLVVDRATFPSDTVSTHVIHAPGVARLARWGLLDEVVATGCPSLPQYSFDFGPFTIKGTPPPVERMSVGYAPRRTVLDLLLVEAAVRAGAELRERFSVEEVVIEDGVVVGIRGHDEGGASVVERARVVIGADGRGSHVAKAVRPEQYHEKPNLQWSSYSYFRGLPVDGFETIIRDRRGWAAIPTNDDLTLVVVGAPIADAPAYKADVEGTFFGAFEQAPNFAARMKAAERVERFRSGSVVNYFRKPHGPGWVLVGDAGYNKDPITAQGISDAFRDADACAGALDDVFTGRRSFEEAMSEQQRIRDEHALPIYEFTTQLATLEPPPPEVQQLLHAVSGNQEAMDAFVGVVAGTVSPLDFFAPEHIERVMRLAAA